MSKRSPRLTDAAGVSGMGWRAVHEKLVCEHVRSVRVQVARGHYNGLRLRVARLTTVTHAKVAVGGLASRAPRQNSRGASRSRQSGRKRSVARWATQSIRRSILAMPLMCGPGAIATVLGMTSLIRNSQLALASFLAIALAIVATMLVTYLCLAYAKTLLGRIGPMGIDAVTRIVGFSSPPSAEIGRAHV